jgi:peptidoglycan/xylan/chitin deacetylase (PgdA/CDA1 family)
MPGIFTISIDFEIHWGVSDHRTVESYEENLRNEPVAVKRLLKLFERRGIHATWATVGMLFCRNKKELFDMVAPANHPTYNDKKLSNYLVAEQAGENESSDPYHFAASVMQEIVNTPMQELSTHTYSHYYCLEPGQTPQQFGHDLAAARKLLEREGVQPVSIVFPRNQYNADYLEQCKKNGFYCYRGNYPSWIYRPQAKSTEGKWKRAARFIDTYLPLAGQRYVRVSKENGMVNVPASCFLRPYSRKFAFLEGLRIRRIKKEMEVAARKDALYHLWWHPHNFGKDMDKNVETLEIILDHFDTLATRYGMRSLNMKEIYEQY